MKKLLTTTAIVLSIGTNAIAGAVDSYDWSTQESHFNQYCDSDAERTFSDGIISAADACWLDSWRGYTNSEVTGHTFWIRLDDGSYWSMKTLDMQKFNSKDKLVSHIKSSITEQVVANLEAKYEADLAAAKANYNSKIAEFKTGYESMISDLEEKRDTLISELATADADIVAKAQEIANLNDNISSLENMLEANDISAMANAVAMQAMIDTLTGDLSAANETIADLNSKLSDKQDEINAWYDKETEWNDDIAALVAERDTLAAELAEYDVATKGTTFDAIYQSGVDAANKSFEDGFAAGAASVPTGSSITQEDLNDAFANGQSIGEFFGEQGVKADFRAAAAGGSDLVGYDNKVFTGISGINLSDTPAEFVKKVWESGYFEGYQYGLTVHGTPIETIVEVEKIVEVEVEVEKIVEVEVIKEVEKIVEVEVIKEVEKIVEVPVEVEVIKEVEVPVEVEVEKIVEVYVTDQAAIDALQSQLDAANLALESVADVTTQLVEADTAIAKLVSDLTDRNETIATLNANIENHLATITAKDIEIANLDAVIEDNIANINILLETIQNSPWNDSDGDGYDDVSYDAGFADGVSSVGPTRITTDDLLGG